MNTSKINQNILFYSKTQTLIIARITVGMTINTSRMSQPSIKQCIFINVHVRCLFIVRFSKLKDQQKAGTLHDTSRLGLEMYLGAKLSPNQLSRVVMTALHSPLK